MEEKELTMQAEKIMEAANGGIYNLEALDATGQPCFIVREIETALDMNLRGYNALALQEVKNIGRIIWKIRNRANRSGIVIALYKAPIVENSQEEAAQWREAAKQIEREAARNRSASYTIADKELAEMTEEETKAAISELVTGFISKSNVAGYGMQRFLDELEDAAAGNAVKTGFPSVDAILGGKGILPGLFTIGAEPGAGKTAFCMQIADQVASQGRSVFVYALEMTAAQLEARSISRATFIEAWKNETKEHQARPGWIPKGAQTALSILDKAAWTETTFNAANRYFEEIGKKLYIREARGMTAEDISGEVALWVQTTGEKPLVIIDYLQLIKPTDENLTATQATAAATQKLLDLARTYKVPVLLVSAFNRSSYDGTNGKSSFRDASDIEYSSETAAILQNVDVLEAVESAGSTLDKQRKAATDARIQSREARHIRLLLVKSRNSREYQHADFTFYGGYSLFVPYNEKAASSSTVRLQ